MGGAGGPHDQPHGQHDDASDGWQPLVLPDDHPMKGLTVAEMDRASASASTRAHAQPQRIIVPVPEPLPPGADPRWLDIEARWYAACARSAARQARPKGPRQDHHPEPQTLRPLWRRCRELWSDIRMLFAWPEALLAQGAMRASDHRGLCGWLRGLETVTRALLLTLALRLHLDPAKRSARYARSPTPIWTPRHAATWPAAFRLLQPDRSKRRRGARPRVLRDPPPKPQASSHEFSVWEPPPLTEAEREAAALSRARRKDYLRRVASGEIVRFYPQPAPPRLPWIERDIATRSAAFRLEALRRVIKAPGLSARRFARLIERMKAQNAAANDPQPLTPRLFPPLPRAPAPRRRGRRKPKPLPAGVRAVAADLDSAVGIAVRASQRRYDSS